MTDIDRITADADREIAEADFVLMTVKEYASLRRIHVQTVYTAIRQGNFKLKVDRETPGTILIRVPRESIGSRKSA